MTPKPAGVNVSDEAVQAAAKAFYEYEGRGDWDNYGMPSVHHSDARDVARAVLAGAVPYIEAEIRAKIADEFVAMGPPGLQRNPCGITPDYCFGDGSGEGVMSNEQEIRDLLDLIDKNCRHVPVLTQTLRSKVEALLNTTTCRQCGLNISMTDFSEQWDAAPAAPLPQKQQRRQQ